MLILNGFDFLIWDYPETVMSNPFPVSHWFKQNTCLHYGFGWRPVDLHDWNLWYNNDVPPDSCYYDFVLWYFFLYQQPSPGSEKLQVLFEQWMICDGHWSESTFYQQLKVSHLHRRRGARKWLTQSELAAKYNSINIAQKIVTAKLRDPELRKTQVRDHKDAPGDPDSRLWQSARIFQKNSETKSVERI